MLSFVDNENLPGLLLIADFEKAFDTLYINFIWNVLDSFNFGQNIIDWCKILYHDTRSSVLVNGHLSTYFDIQRGCRQGDPLSPYLFILSIEVLCILIRCNERIKGIPVNDIQLKLSLYADDAIFFLDGSEQSLAECVKEINFFSSLSGLKLNYSKSSLIWVGSKKYNTARFCKDIPFIWNDGKKFEYLGIIFSLDVDAMVNCNYDNTFNSIISLSNLWSKRNLSVMGKVVVVKSILLSKLTYVASALPNPDNSMLTKLNSLFYKFLWGGSDRIKRLQMIQNFNQGGVKMVDVFSYVKSLKLKWIQRILISADNNWVQFLYFYFNQNFHCESFFEIDSSCLDYLTRQYPNRFWKDTLNIYKDFLDLTRIAYGGNNILQQSVWYNDVFKMDNKVMFNKDMYDSGIRCVNDLLDDNNNFYTWDFFVERFNIRLNFLTFHGIICSIIKDGLKKHSDNFIKSTNLYLPYSISVILNSYNDKSYFYNFLTKD